MEEGAEYVGFETLLRESDVLSLNLPLTVSLLSPHCYFIAVFSLPPLFPIHLRSAARPPDIRSLTYTHSPKPTT
jgi:hypothetical protein